VRRWGGGVDDVDGVKVDDGMGRNRMGWDQGGWMVADERDLVGLSVLESLSGNVWECLGFYPLELMVFVSGM
jgi:hypothetical protein